MNSSGEKFVVCAATIVASRQRAGGGVRASAKRSSRRHIRAG